MALVTITTSLSAETIMPKSISAPRVLLALIALHACTTGDIKDGDVGPGEPGRLVIIGGALQADNATVYQAIVEARAGGGRYAWFRLPALTPQSRWPVPCRGWLSTPELVP